MTITGKHRALVKETEHGTPFISFELMDHSDSSFKKADIGMILNKGLSYEEVEKLANTINEKMIGLFISNF